jgi:hypothetical protein
MKDQKLFDRLKAGSVLGENGCWNWTKCRRKKGHWSNAYGLITVVDKSTARGHRTMTTHRAMMIAIHGPLLPSQIVCHKCDNVLCCNPDHLWIGTNKENTLDSRKKNRHYEGRKTHCQRGHPLSGDNIRTFPSSKPGTRVCLACMRGRTRMRVMGWPEHLAFELSPLPLGKEIDKITGEIATTKAYRRAGK